MYALRQFTKLLWSAIAWAGIWVWKIAIAPFMLVYWGCLMVARGVRAVAILVYRGARRIILTIKATPGALWRAPLRAYRRLAIARTWVMAKAEYLQGESAKWRALFRTVKAPYSFLRACGLNPQMATSLLIAGTAVGSGVVVNETLFSEPSFARGDSGIFYAPSDVPSFFSESYNTLRVDLGAVAVKSIEITDVSVGTAFTGSTLPSGETTAIDIGGNVLVAPDVSTWLYVGEMVFEKNRCETLTLSDINVHTLNITDNASDGQSLSAGAGTMRNQAILGGHGMASAMSTTGGLYDRVLIQAPTSGVNGQIDSLVISNLYTKGGDCLLSRIKGGTLTIRLNEVGGDSSLTTKAFTVATTVTASVINMNGNVEVVMAVPSTQTIDE